MHHRSILTARKALEASGAYAFFFIGAASVNNSRDTIRAYAALTFAVFIGITMLYLVFFVLPSLY